MPVSFELLHSLKELQLQHGLRSDDFARYHAHCTGRIRTLRKQLKLGSEYKKVGNRGAAPGAKVGQPVAYVSPKAVTPNNATTPQHVLLIALTAERAWAESQEAAAAAAGATVHQQQTSATRHTSDGGKKRLNKAKALAAELRTVCESVGTERLQLQAVSFSEMMHGRCAIAHSRFEAAKEHFSKARTALLSLRQSGTQALWDVAVALIVECDDRIAFAHQHLGLPAYAAPAVPQSVEGTESSEGSVVSHVTWNNRKVPVLCLRAKQALRLCNELDAEATCSALLAAVHDTEKQHGLTAAAWVLFQLQSAYNRALDVTDRSVTALNDAIDAVQHDLRDSSGTGGAGTATERTRALRALQLFLQFRVHRTTVNRTVLVTAYFRARFHLSLQLLDLTGVKPTLRLNLQTPLAQLCPAYFGQPVTGSSTSLPTAKSAYRKGRREFSFGPQHIASPPEIERLCDTTIRVADEALMLPGVDGDEALSGPLSAAKALAEVQRDLYSAEGWLIVARDGKTQEARQAARGCLQRALKTCKMSHFPEAPLYEPHIEALLVSIAAIETPTPPAAESYTIASSAPVLLRTSSKADATYAAERPANFVVQAGFARVPPSFQSMPAKAAFVDVAATYLDLPTRAPVSAAPAPAAARAAVPPPVDEPAAPQAAGQEKKKGWLGSLWGR